MTPESQRIAIEEVCGTRFENDPLQDLNAMHEAEKVLTAEQEEQYVLILEELITPDFLSKDQTELSMEAVMFRDVHATAGKKAEAFLRTLGKWKDFGVAKSGATVLGCVPVAPLNSFYDGNQ